MNEESIWWLIGTWFVPCCVLIAFGAVFDGYLTSIMYATSKGAVMCLCVIAAAAWFFIYFALLIDGSIDRWCNARRVQNSKEKQP
jgi:hypothetical protein